MTTTVDTYEQHHQKFLLQMIAEDLRLRRSPHAVIGKNFVTPTKAGTWKLPAGRIVELAVGVSLDGSSWLYGVTVRPDTLNANTKLSRVCFDLDELRSHLNDVISSLQEQEEAK